MNYGHPYGTMLGARIAFTPDWPAKPMPIDDSAPECSPAGPYLPRHAAGVEAAPVSPALVTCLVQCWEPTHPAGAHSERGDCDKPFPVEAPRR